MNRVVELYEANHLMVLVIVFVGFVIYINAIKNKFRKSLIVQNKVEDEDENEDEIVASAPRIYIGSRVIIKYILTDDIVEIEICDTQNRRENNVVFVNHHMPLATSLLNKEVGDIIKFKKNTTDKNYIYVEVHQIGEYTKEEKIQESQVEDEMDLNTANKSINMKFKEYSYSRFRVTQEMYNYLLINPNMGLKINVSKNNGNHPIGYYEIPHNVAIRFIEEKQKFPNWEDYQNFNQETIPTELRDYFTRVPSNNINPDELDKKTSTLNTSNEVNVTKVLNEVPKQSKEIIRTIKDNEILSYFIISEILYGQNRQITVKFKNGAHVGEIYTYNHDEVYDNTIEYYSILPVWQNRRSYSNSRNIPGNVLPFVIQLN